jgi:TonB-dependent starch-binding outer membrane protein SusC
MALLLLPLWGLAQQPVRGRVVSATDQTPLPGATVLVKGTGQGTATDAEGYFTLPSVSAEAVLVVNFLGYTSREFPLPAPLPDTLVISLAENTNTLGEVVVSTGYQTLPQERVTGSFEQVSAEQLQEQAGPDVLSRLEAVANGVTVNRGTLAGNNLLIRGLSTIQGPKEPLIVVDNFPYEGDLSNLNPNDVESITILRDAAAASIWGARAGNGVIVITTKKGRFDQPLRVTFNSSLTVSDKPDLSGISSMSGADFIEVEQMLFGKGYYTSAINSASRPVLSPVVELLLQQASGTISGEQLEAQLAALRQRDVRDDFSRYVYQKGVNQQYSLGLQGGSGTHAWLLSAGYDRTRSTLDAGFNRLNLHFRNTLRPVKNLSLSTGFAYTQSQTESGRTGFGTSVPGLTLYPYSALADEAGNPLPLARDFRQAYKEGAGNGKLLDWSYYPLTDYLHDRSTTELQEVLANTGLSYTLPLGLEASLRYQYQRQHTAGEHLQGEQSYAARHLVNLYTSLDPVTGEATYAIPRGAILDASSTLLEAHNGRGQLTYNKAWGDHEVAALGGGELRHARTTGSSHRLYGYNPNILLTGLVDYVKPYPTFVNGSAAFVPHMDEVSDRVSRFVSVFGNAAYTYKQRYTLTGSARQDASNLFGVRSNDRWNPLWSAGLAWEVSREPFYGLGLLPFLKLRATQGYSGNIDQSKSALTTIYYSSQSPYTLTPTAVYAGYANPDLRWEKSRMLNLGLDFRFQNNRLSGSVEYYRKHGSDLYGRELIDYTTGIGSTVTRNVASMEGSGLDVSLQSLNVQAGPFSWSTDLNLSHARDEVTEYYLSNLNASAFVGSVPNISALPGRPVYAIYSYKWAGLDPLTGNPQGFVKGEVSQDYATMTGSATQVTDLNFHGSALPTVFGSLGNTFSYKNFSLTARVSYKLGYYFRRKGLRYGSLYAAAEGHSDYARRWQQPGDEARTDVPSLVYPANSRRDNFYAGSAALVERGDHLRLAYLTASYELARSEKQTLSVRSLRAYASAGNLGLLWRANREGLDPDYALSSGAVPPGKSYTLGLTLTF